MCATPGYVWCPARWNMTSLLTLTPNVLQRFTGHVTGREREGEWQVFQQIGLFTSQLFFFLPLSLCLSGLTRQMPRSQAKGCLSSSPRNLAVRRGAAGSLESPTILSGFLPNVDLVLVFVRNCFVCTCHPFLSYYISPCHPLSFPASCTPPKFLPFHIISSRNPPLKSTSVSDPVSHAWFLLSCTHLRARKNHTANTKIPNTLIKHAHIFFVLLKKWQQNGFKDGLCCRSSHLQTFWECESVPPWGYELLRFVLDRRHT